jgi:bifunctional non-homologous end joining protein LigD
MLEEYKKKRDFRKTPEPAPAKKAGAGLLKFVVHKHSARRLHYDLRLELDGVLKSWALPNGPSLDPKVKRLAVMVEDHPLEYGSFEGSIPEGEYGAGKVIIWDAGTYSAETENKEMIADRDQAQDILRQGLEKGKIGLTFKGQKLKGSWALVKMQHTQKDWLLIKHKDDFAASGTDILSEGNSVYSGLTIDDLKQHFSVQKPSALKIEEVQGVTPVPFPLAVSPMLATLIPEPFNDPHWIFEPKLDGYRILTFIQNGKVRLISRNGLEVTSRYPFLIPDLVAQPAADLILDGEMVALDETGRSCFQCLQNHLKQIVQKKGASTFTAAAIVYYIFDVLYFNGYDLRSVPLIERKKVLSSILHPSVHLKPVEYFETDGESLFEASVSYGMEGIIAKRKDSLYETGQRSQKWLKIKTTQSEEFVIGGYTQGTGNREKTFGALLLGNFNDKGELIFAGHVGTGFDDELLAEMRTRLDALKLKTSPFKDKLPLNAPTTWIKPVLVAEIKFAEKTIEGYLRQPVFLRLREDKNPSEAMIIPQTPPAQKKTLLQPAKGIENIAGQIIEGSSDFKINVDGYDLSLSNLDKLLWPVSGSHSALTKRDLLVYLTRVSPFILPHLRDRPVTLTRYPNGITGPHFYQKHIDTPIPEFVNTVSISEHFENARDYFVCHNLATLLWLGQLGNIDIHSWFSRIVPDSSMCASDRTPDKKADYFTNFPDFIIFDIDPYMYSGKEIKGAEPELNIAAFKQTSKVALWLKTILDSLSLNSFVKTSGRTGLHVFVPIYRQLDFSAVHSAAKTICGFMLKQHPDEITIEWTVTKRTGKIFLDYNQNVRGKTLASIYSPRPAPQASVSTPVRWDELEKVYPTDFTIKTVPDRLSRIGDIWSDILDQRTDLKKVLGLSGLF